MNCVDSCSLVLLKWGLNECVLGITKKVIKLEGKESIINFLFVSEVIQPTRMTLRSSLSFILFDLFYSKTKQYFNIKQQVAYWSWINVFFQSEASTFRYIVTYNFWGRTSFLKLLPFGMAGGLTRSWVYEGFKGKEGNYFRGGNVLGELFFISGGELWAHPVFCLSPLKILAQRQRRQKQVRNVDRNSSKTNVDSIMVTTRVPSGRERLWIHCVRCRIMKSLTVKTHFKLILLIAEALYLLL